MEETTSTTLEPLEVLESDDEEQAVRRLQSSTGWNFWMAVLKVPAAFYVINVLAFTFMGTFDFWIERRHGMNISGISFLLFLDAVACVWAATYLERELCALNSEEEKANRGEHVASSDSNSTSYIHVHAKASKRFDAFLGYLKPPKTATFVGLLHVLATLACAVSLVIFFVDPTQDVACSNKVVDRSIEEKLPAPLQDWANGLTSRNHYEHPPAGQSDFIHMSNGESFFLGKLPENQTQYGRSSGMYMENGRNLMSTGKDGSFTIYPNVSTDKTNPFISIEGDPTASTKFCLLYAGLGDFRQDGIVERVLCVSDDEDTTSKPLRNITIWDPDRFTRSYSWIEGQSATAYNGDLWFSTVYGRIGRDRRDRVAEYYRIQTDATLTLFPVLNITLSSDNEMSYNEAGPCVDWKAKLLAAVLGLLVVGPASFWLLKIKQSEAGISPLTFWAYWLVDSDFAAAMSLFILLASTVCLITDNRIAHGRKCGGIQGSPLLHAPFTRESVIWLHYSLWVYLSFGGFIQHRQTSVFFGFLGILLGLIMDHQVLQTTGCFLAIVQSTWAVLYFLFSDYPGGQEMVFVFFFSICLGCGTTALGNTLRKFRPLIRYYCRRLWKIVIKSFVENDAGRSPHSTPTAQASEESGENELRRSLIRDG